MKFFIPIFSLFLTSAAFAADFKELGFSCFAPDKGEYFVAEGKLLVKDSKVLMIRSMRFATSFEPYFENVSDAIFWVTNKSENACPKEFTSKQCFYLGEWQHTGGIYGASFKHDFALPKGNFLSANGEFKALMKLTEGTWNEIHEFECQIW